MRPDAEEGVRSCLHCTLARAVRAEVGEGASVTATRSEAVWLPLSGASLYRGVRRLLRAVRDQGGGEGIRLVILDLPGKSHVEVTATVRRAAGRARVHSIAFPRSVLDRLAGGFAEVAPGSPF